MFTKDTVEDTEIVFSLCPPCFLLFLFLEPQQRVVWVAVVCVTQATSIRQTKNRHFYSFGYDIGLSVRHRQWFCQ